MNFELLPNELILYLYEYLSIIDLFHGFYGLNSRLNKLLCIQFQKFRLDFRLISKTNFTNICENYLPLIIKQIISLHLSNDDDTPQQIELFLSFPFKLHQFIRLQSISLSNIQSQQTLDKIMIQCSNLYFLTHLTFTNCEMLVTENDAKRFYNQIWSLPKLTHCYLRIWFRPTNSFPNPTIISLSITHLSISRASSSLSTFAHLCHYTPNLQNLEIKLGHDSDNLEISLPILQITRLKIILFRSSINLLIHVLKNMPNLYHLTFKTYHIYINGHEWEEIITKYLPKLKLFQLDTFFPPPLNIGEREAQLNEIVDSFRTRFWIDERQWFIRCHWYLNSTSPSPHSIRIFTLPYIGDMFNNYSNCILAKSTCPYDDGKDMIFDRAKYLKYESKYFTNSVLSNIHFSNIESLELSFPFKEEFLFNVVQFNRLTSLSVSVERDLNLDYIESQLQFVLDRAPHLNSIRFSTWLSTSLPVLSLNITSASIRQLDLQGYTCDDEYYCFDNEQSIQLSCSSLGIQCETLLISVKNRRNIVDLVNTMPNLQALIVQCADDSCYDENNLVLTREDELVEWLRQNLPSTCTIARDACNVYNIRLWIR